MKCSNNNYYRLLLLGFSFPTYIVFASMETDKEDYSIQPLAGGFVGYHGIQSGNRAEVEFNYGLAGGLRFNPRWSWMIKYQYSDSTDFDSTKYNVDLGIVSNTLRHEWYIKPDVSIMAGLGAAYWQEEQNSVGKANGWSPVATLGINNYYLPNFSFQSAYQYIHDIGESERNTKYDLHNFTFGIVYQYGQGKAEIIPTPDPRPMIEEEKEAEPILIVEKLDINEIFHFNFDSTIIIESTDSLIKQLNSKLSQYPEAKIRILGHTDSVGSDAYNERLSLRRAQSLLEILKANGINNREIEIKGEGSRHPIASNATKQGRAKNRRVELRIEE